MTWPRMVISVAWLFFILALGAETGTLKAADPDPAVQKTFDKLLNAIQANDREAFVAEGSEAVKEGTTQEIMDSLHERLGIRLKKGYEATYLCQLKQQGCQVYLWKLTFKEGGDDVVGRLSLKDGKIAGFFLQ